MTRRTWARSLTKKVRAFGSVAQHRYRRSGRCAEVTQDRVELLTLPIRFDRDAAEKPLLPLVITYASQHDLERSHLIGSNRFHMAAVDRDRDRARRWGSYQWLGSQYLTLQFGANLKGSAARRFDRRRMAKRKEFRHQSYRAAISGQTPHFGKNALVFWGATIRHDLSQRADNSTRGNPAAAGIEARGLDLRDAEQCRQLARAPILDGAPRAAMRTFPAMITISIGLGLNQLRLHRGENGLALGQAKPMDSGEITFVGWSPVIISRVRTLRLFPLAPTKSATSCKFPGQFSPELYSTPNFETVSRELDCMPQTGQEARSRSCSASRLSTETIQSGSPELDGGDGQIRRGRPRR